MSTAVEHKSLHERIKDARLAKQETEDAWLRGRGESLRRKVKETLGVDNVEISFDGPFHFYERDTAPGEPIAVVEGIRFVMVGSSIALLGECQNCHRETRSNEIYDLAQLGELMDNFTPAWGHYCGADNNDSPEKRLVTALRDLFDSGE